MIIKSVDYQKCLLNEYFQDRYRQFSPSEVLCWNVSLGVTEGIKFLIQAGGDPKVLYRDEKLSVAHPLGLKSLIDIAALRGDIKMIETLIRLGVLSEEADAMGAVASSAVKCRSVEVLKWAIKQGGKPTSEDLTSFVEHCRDGHESTSEILNILLSFVSPKSEELLFQALDKCNEEAAIALISHGSFNLNAKNGQGEPLLYVAARDFMWHVVKALVEAGADKGATTPAGLTAWDAARSARPRDLRSGVPSLETLNALLNPKKY